MKIPIDCRNAILCALLSGVSVLAVNPVLEMGVNDDWSYTFSALQLALTGRLTYNGWSEPIIGAQACWAALWIKVFGFSFTLVRWSALPFAVGSAWLLYLLGRRAGLKASLALLGTLTIVLSPLFIPLAASFMTDVPAFFFLVACAYGGLRSLESTAPRHCLAWLALAAVAGFTGGTVRQIVWGEPVLLLPCVIWNRRRNRAIVAGGASIWGASALAAALVLWWHQQQRYVLPERLPWALPFMTPAPRALLGILFRFAVSSALIILPVLLTYTAGRRTRLKPLLAAVGALLVPWGLWRATSAGYLPLLGNMVTGAGILRPSQVALGYAGTALTRPVRGALAAILFVASSCCLASFFQSFGDWLKARRNTGPKEFADRGLVNFLLAFGPFAAWYILVLVVAEGSLIDRYFLPLMPAVVIPLLWQFERRVQQQAPLVAWLALAIFALYGVATTHDYLAAARARLAAATEVAARGVPRTSITAGFEYDAWTQLEQTGYVRSFELPPPDSAGWPPAGDARPIWTNFWFRAATPSIDPRYFVVHSAQPDLVASQFPRIQYIAWLPPFRRSVTVQTLP